MTISNLTSGQGAEKKRLFLQPRSLAVALGLLTLLLTLLAAWWLERSLMAKERRVAASLLSSRAYALSAAINADISLLHGLAAFASATPSAEIEDHFVVFASGLYAGSQQIRNLALAPDGVLRYVYPSRGNEAVLGVDLLKHPKTRRDAVRAMETRQVTLSDPSPLLQGGIGLVARKAIFSDLGEFWGFASIVVDLGPVLAQAGLDDQPYYSITLLDRAGRVIHGDPAVLANSPVTMDVELPEGRWRLAAIPKAGWVEPIAREMLVFNAISFLAALLLALLIYHTYDKQRRLSEMVEARGFALKESESYNRTLFQLSPMGLALCRMDGTFIDVNPAFAAILGRSVEESTGLNYLDISPPRYADRDAQQFELLAREGSYGPYEKEFLDKEGRPVPVRLQGRVIERERERFIWSSVENISDRKRLEEMLTERNKQLTLFAEHSPAAIAMLDREMRYMIVSRRWIEDYHLEGQQIIGHSHYQVFPEVPERWKEIHRRCLAGEVVRADEEPFHRLDGSVNWLRWEIHPWYGASGEVGGIIIFSEDITERKRAEVALRREYAFTEALIDSLPGVVYLYDQELKFLRWNKNLELLLGYSGEEIRELSPLDFFGADEKELVGSKIKEVFDTGASNVEADFVAKDGTRTPYFFTGVRTVIDDRVCLIGIGIDIAKRKKLEEELTTLNLGLEKRVEERTRELEESRRALLNLVEDLNAKRAELTEANEKLRGMDRLKSMFIATMSHELRTPLNSVIGYSSIILNGWLGPVTDEQREHLGVVLKAGKHLLSLINDVLDLSKIEAGQVDVHEEEFDLFDLVAEAAKQLEREIREKGLDFTVENIHLAMRSDRRRLLQATLNLLSNAMKYTLQGSITLAAREEGGWAEIEVRDTGIGISEQDAALIFQPFMRLESALRNSVSGTGLGLYLTRKLVCEVLNGSIGFTSRGGEGSSFVIRVPSRAGGGKETEGRA